MNFGVYGPFVMKRSGDKKLIDDESRKDLKAQLAQCAGLENACGCYVFAVRAGKGYKPWYAGKSEKNSILNECMNSSNINKYNAVFNGKHNGGASIKKGNPVMFLVPMLTPAGKFKKPTKGTLPSLRFLERWLIAECLRKNPFLANNKETAFLRTIHVKGIMNAKQGEANADATELGRAIW